MRKYAFILATMALGLSACSTAKVDLPGTVSALASAGCSGTLTNKATVQSASGLSAGSWSISHEFSGSCDPAKASHPVAVSSGNTTQ